MPENRCPAGDISLCTCIRLPLACSAAHPFSKCIFFQVYLLFLPCSFCTFKAVMLSSSPIQETLLTSIQILFPLATYSDRCWCHWYWCWCRSSSSSALLSSRTLHALLLTLSVWNLCHWFWYVHSCCIYSTPTTIPSPNLQGGLNIISIFIIVNFFMV